MSILKNDKNNIKFFVILSIVIIIIGSYLLRHPLTQAKLPDGWENWTPEYKRLVQYVQRADWPEKDKEHYYRNIEIAYDEGMEYDNLPGYIKLPPAKIVP